MNTNSLHLNLNNHLVDLSTPIVMGIVNVTPDSFYKGNRFTSDKDILRRTEDILSQGAQIVDIGGYSTRPSAEHITQEDETRRVSDALEIILKKFPDITISVDTFRSGVARHVANNFHVAIINDIGGGTLDDLMFETIADLQIAYVLMHTRGTPQIMQTHTLYKDIVSDILQYFEKKLAQLHQLGVKDVIIDPGFGFAKTLEQNHLLLNKMSYFKELNTPILVGVSRKSMIYDLIGANAENALNGTTAANMLALLGGAAILRVHDVKEAVEAITIYQEYDNYTKSK